MNLRKWSALAISTSLIALLSAGLIGAAPQDDEKEEETLEKLMEGVSSANSRINRYVRTPVAFRKYKDDIVEYSESLVELGKKSKKREEEAIKKVVEGTKDPKKKWAELMDAFIEASEELVETAKGGDQAKAKAAHTTVKRTCADCHKVFRHEDDF